MAGGGDEEELGEGGKDYIGYRVGIRRSQGKKVQLKLTSRFHIAFHMHLGILLACMIVQTV